jgi:heterodisulfide reductase subunit B
VTDTSKATARPWKFKDNGYVENEGVRVGEWFMRPSKSMLTEMELATNSYQTMLEALKAIADHIPKSSASEGGASAHSSHVRAADKVRAAITFAEGKQS